ncbi:MAG TPA: flavodoxin domain-containing protein [Candidatus Anoxymicrobiaceae bacterium]|jgi:menaquinone-dependent protoporphyrinogen IX oxidase
MKGVVVYQSWWGSCRKIAEVIGKGLTESGHDARVQPVDEAPAPDPALDFVVIGASTRWPGARPKIKRCAKKFAKALAGKPFAAFSTGGTVFADKPNTQAAELIYDILEKDGMKPLAPPLIIGMEGYKPPPALEKGTLPDSEIDRAMEFAREIGAKLSSTPYSD